MLNQSHKENQYSWAPQTFKVKMSEKKKFIQDAIKKPGALHKALHIKEGQKIPDAKLKSAEHSKSPLMRKRATLAETLKGFNKK